MYLILMPFFFIFRIPLILGILASIGEMYNDTEIIPNEKCAKFLIYTKELLKKNLVFVNLAET